MATSLKILQQAGDIERRLSELDCKTTLSKLEPYSDYPEVAKVIDYIKSYKTNIPSGHMVFQFIEAIKSKEDNKKKAKSLIRKKLNPNATEPVDNEEEYRKSKVKRTEQEVKEEKERVKKEYDKALKQAEEMEALLNTLEMDCDAAYDFFNKNANSMGNVVKPFRLAGVRNMLIAIKNNMRALKVR